MQAKFVPTAIPVALAFVLVAMSARSAHAYLDPGTGSMILQILLGGLAGLAIAGKLYWYKFLSLIGLKSKPADKPDEEEDRLARTGVGTER
jgi:hypothetical protein